MRSVKPVIKKRFILMLIIFLFIPQVYVVSDCLAKGPCIYNYKFNFTFMILWKLLPHLSNDLFAVLVFLFLTLISLIIAFFIANIVIRERRKF